VTILAVVAAALATALADLRWWRVAQREHYLPGSATRFALRWWMLGPNRVLAAAATLGVILSPISPLPAIGGALAIAIGPFRYPLRGRSPGPLAWTTRMKTVAAVTVAAQIIVGAALSIVRAAPFVALVAPLTIDAALLALTPIEDRQAQKFVDDAKARLEHIHPTVIGITGSYGKTTTKVYAAHLIAGAHTVVPTPASFNNRAGLSRAINEHLVPGTDVFIAEMGTYGKGEIAAMCAWCPPRVSAITAIGPVHLERFGDEAAIVEAKSEILKTADTIVLNVDDDRLAALATPDKTVWRCSTTDPTADVYAMSNDGRLTVQVKGELLATVNAGDVALGNVTAAVALALAVNTPRSVLTIALQNLPVVSNRRAQVTLSTGATAIDDTFNSNPAGCRAALAAMQRAAHADGKRIVVTPGMVELGSRQPEENAAFAKEAAAAATQMVIVGFTNRKALLEGATGGAAKLFFADTHERAVDWIRANTAAQDVVLYEGQLPDHYP
jgi:UDP-N-acetylmuramoyl-tripeptide--D-alanyl-D-alanine ligase